MWNPTHVQLLVKSAKGLNVKGKNGTNDAFVSIALGKEKFQTSVKVKSSDLVQWNEQCELSIPSQGNKAELSLTVMHRNFLGVDEFLGQITLPLRDLDMNERQNTRWYTLKCKSGQDKTDYRGELEVKTRFAVKANFVGASSEVDVTKKNKGSILSMNKVFGSIGGSLISLDKKKKKLKKKIAKSESVRDENVKEKEKTQIISKKKKKGEIEPIQVTKWNPEGERDHCDQDVENQDPGVISDDEEQFDDLSNQGSIRSLSRFSLEHIDLELPTSFGNEAPTVSKQRSKVRSRSGKAAPGIKTFAETEKSSRKCHKEKSPTNNEKNAKNENERVHKNSMEEWEARLCVQKQKISAVDRLVEKNAGEQKGRISTAECIITGPENKEMKNKSRLFSLSRPKSLDLGNFTGKKQNLEYSCGMVNENFIEKDNQNCEIIPVKPRKKSKSENISPEEESVEENLDLHTLPRTKKIRTKGILKRMSTIQTEQSSPTQGSPEQEETEKRKRSQSSPPSNFKSVGQTFDVDKTGSVKKKIIPIYSYSDSSPSTENLCSPTLSPILYQKNRSRMSKSTVNLAMHEDKEMERKKKSLGVKLNNSYSSILDLMKNAKVKGHNDKYRNVSGGICNPFDAERSPNYATYSDGYQGPPDGTRIVLGREKSPTPDLPHEVLKQYNGKTREDLIQMVVTNQATVDLQACRLIDLEDYIDELTIKVLEIAPVLFERECLPINNDKDVDIDHSTSL